MKRTFITVTAILLACYGLNAQTKKDRSKAEKQVKRQITEISEFKADGKSFSTELNVNPFRGDLRLNNSLNQIKFRYFTNPGFALRLGVNVTSTDSTVSNRQVYGSTSGNNNTEGSQESFTVAANFGFEKHFKGTRRLSPYLGLDFSIADRSCSGKSTAGNTTTEIKNAWYRLVPYTTYSSSGGYQTTYTTVISDPAYTRFGLNLVTGFDFYMAKDFFFGYEFNFGFITKKYKDPETTVRSTTGQPSGTVIEYETKNRSSSFGPSLMNGIRIGYVF